MAETITEYPKAFRHRPNAVIAQVNPVSGTRYVVLPTTRNVRIIGIVAAVTWTVQPSPLEVHVTVDGQVLTFPRANPATATDYGAVFAMWGLNLDNTDYQVMRAFLMEGHSVQIEAETTGGTVQLLGCTVIYETKD